MAFVIIQLAGFKVLKLSLKSFKCIKTRTDVRTVAFFFSLCSLFLSKAPVLKFLFPSQNTVSPCSHPSLF